jgi:plastocyanin
MGARRPFRIEARWSAPALVLSLILAPSALGRPAADGTGTIEGQILYDGDVPRPTIVMEGGRTQQVLYVGQNHGLRYAVIALRAASAIPTRAPDSATLNQSGFVFEPQVLAVREGQPVHFTNEDGANHNVRSEAEDVTNRFSIYTGAGQMQTRRFRAHPVERPLVITCDIHPWMIAWIYSFAHPYFAVTDAAGHFQISGVPGGLHQLSVRQPAGGLQRDARVQVAAGQVAHVTIRFTSNDVTRSERSNPAE